MKTTLAAIVLAAVAGYSAAGDPQQEMNRVFSDLTNLTLIGTAEREQRCSKSAEKDGCRSAFDQLITQTFDAESKFFQAARAAAAGDYARRDALFSEMNQALRDGRAELERLKSLHVP
ncbi:hypothetical protein JNK62_03525 [bacterium]|nr:hypothetical protein [bacterium]